MTEADFITLSQFSSSVNLNFMAQHFCCITCQSMVRSTCHFAVDFQIRLIISAAICAHITISH